VKPVVETGRKRKEGEAQWKITGSSAGSSSAGSPADRQAADAGRDPGGCIITILLGIAGALLAGWIGHAVGWYGTGEGAGFIAAIVGAFLILLIYR
jgi:uncharacterized membrane protein YeaQ/YmgE (transglycosylase-associated protein family)